MGKLTGKFQECTRLCDRFTSKPKPDKGYEYSNTNYLLLRKIMDIVLGYDHSAYINEKILEPLSLIILFSIKEVNLEDVMSDITWL